MNRKAQSGLAMRFAALERRLAQLETKINPPAPKPEPTGFSIGSVRFDGQGGVVADPNAKSYDERLRERVESEERRAAAERADRAYFGGCFKICNVWRDGSGRQVPHDQAVELEARANARARGEVVQPDPVELDATKRLPEAGSGQDQAEAPVDPRTKHRATPRWRIAPRIVPQVVPVAAAPADPADEAASDYDPLQPERKE